MSKLENEPRREYTEGERQESFIGRRMDAFADRSREPGDGATWAVVLGALMCTLLMICYSVAGQPMVALGMLTLFAVWVMIMSRLGRVNVLSILWGSATTDADVPPNDVVVFQSTVLLALISLGAILLDAFTGWDFGWYGFILLAIVAIYLVIYLRTWILPTR